MNEITIDGKTKKEKNRNDRFYPGIHKGVGTSSGAGSNIFEFTNINKIGMIITSTRKK